MIEVLFGVRIPLCLRCDHKGVVDHMTSIRLIDDTRTAVQLAAVKEMLQDKEIKDCKHLDGVTNYADCLTKGPPKCIPVSFIHELMGGRVRNMH